jgi:hypothetical protein
MSVRQSVSRVTPNVRVSSTLLDNNGALSRATRTVSLNAGARNTSAQQERRALQLLRERGDVNRNSATQERHCCRETTTRTYRSYLHSSVHICDSLPSQICGEISKESHIRFVCCGVRVLLAYCVDCVRSCSATIASRKATGTGTRLPRRL